MTVHDFGNSLEKAHAVADEPHWENVYRAFFPTFQTMIDMRHDGDHQRQGIDRLVVLANAETVSVEEKYSTYDYRTILLERWHDRDKRVPGWMQNDLRCHYLAYSQLPNEVTFVLPWQTLRTAWQRNGRRWVEQYPHVEARNKGYVTECIAVPDHVVLAAIADCSAIAWDEAPF